jgi:hypothetical protein
MSNVNCYIKEEASYTSISLSRPALQTLAIEQTGGEVANEVRNAQTASTGSSVWRFAIS